MKLIRKCKMRMRALLGLFISVRVYDNYVENIRPKLSFKNKIRLDLGKWMPIGKDSPFGRLVYLKGETECGTPLVKYGRLSDMGKEFTRKGTRCRWTHWQEHQST